MTTETETLETMFRVNWQSMTMANLMDQDECSSIQRFQQLSPKEIHDRIANDPDAAREVGQALVRLVRVTANAAGVGLACALSAIIVSGGRNRASLFAAADDNKTLPVQEFVRALTADAEGDGAASLDAGTKLNASRVVAAFLSSGSPAQLENFSLDTVLNWLNSCLKVDTTISADNLNALRCAAALFRSRAFRLRFIASEGINFICNYVSQTYSQGLTTEVLYRATFCMWSLSYHDEAVSAICAHNITLHLITKSLPHMDDKISRLALSTLVNLLNKEDAEQGVQLNDVMVESNISKALVDLEVRKWTTKDQQDVLDDIGRLRKVLRSKFLSMNSFERYMAELTTGTLKEG